MKSLLLTISSNITVHVPLPCWCLCHVIIYRSTFSDFALKYAKDERFKSVDKMREREQLFADYLAELKKFHKHKEPRATKSKDVVKG